MRWALAAALVLIAMAVGVGGVQFMLGSSSYYILAALALPSYALPGA